MTEGDYPGSGYKYLPAAKLISVLKDLPPDARVICNSVTRNLTVVFPGGAMAMIDFLFDGDIEYF